MKFANVKYDQQGRPIPGSDTRVPAKGRPISLGQVKNETPSPQLPPVRQPS